MKVFAPYLSGALLHRIEDAKACEADWRRQHPDPTLKLPGLDYGLFSGGGLGGLPSPQTFKVEKTEPQKDGSFRIHVSLERRLSNRGRWIVDVMPVVLRDGDHFAVDDVTYPPGSDREPDPPLSAYLSAGCDGSHWIGFGGRQEGATTPEALVRSLYQQVVAHQTLGIPYGINEKIFAPYFSNALLHKFVIAIACANDWYRQDRRRMRMKNEEIEKPPYAWLELGIFSGGSERASPSAFEIENSQTERDGSTRVVVKLTWKESPYTEVWRVAAVVVQEDGHLVLDDVIYPKDKDMGVEYRLSKALSKGCNGPHWVGYRE